MEWLRNRCCMGGRDSHAVLPARVDQPRDFFTGACGAFPCHELVWLARSILQLKVSSPACVQEHGGGALQRDRGFGRLGRRRAMLTVQDNTLTRRRRRAVKLESVVLGAEGYSSVDNQLPKATKQWRPSRERLNIRMARCTQHTRNRATPTVRPHTPRATRPGPGLSVQYSEYTTSPTPHRPASP